MSNHDEKNDWLKQRVNKIFKNGFNEIWFVMGFLDDVLLFCFDFFYYCCRFFKKKNLTMAVFSNFLKIYMYDIIHLKRFFLISDSALHLKSKWNGIDYMQL